MILSVSAQCPRFERVGFGMTSEPNDAAQERGEVKRNGGDRSSVEDRNTASTADLGMRRDEIYEARAKMRLHLAPPLRNCRRQVSMALHSA